MHAFPLVHEGRFAVSDDCIRWTNGRSGLRFAVRLEFRVDWTAGRHAQSRFGPPWIAGCLNSVAQTVPKPKTHFSSPLPVTFGRGQAERGENDRKVLKREILSCLVKPVPIAERWCDRVIPFDQT